MRSRFDDDQNPDIRAVVAEYRDVMRRRLKWVGPSLVGAMVLVLLLSSVYSVNPGEVGVVRTFGRASPDLSQPGLHFALPIVQQVDVVDIANIRRAEIGFRAGQNGPKRVESEALMLTGDENIIEAQMIVQYQVADPHKYLFKLKDPEAVLHVSAEVALRGVVGTMRITSSIEELRESETVSQLQKEVNALEKEAGGIGDEKDGDNADAGDEDGKKAGGDKADREEQQPKPAPQKNEVADPSTDILTTGREFAQNQTKLKLQELMTLYDSGLKITEVKLQVVDAPDEVKDAFHDVVRAREEREQKINQALGYREDRLPKARGEAQKILRAAEAYKQERVLRAQGEAARFLSILAEYEKARGVTRERLHLETLERILGQVEKKVFVDQDVANRALPLLPLQGGAALPQGGQ